MNAVTTLLKVILNFCALYSCKRLASFSWTAFDAIISIIWIMSSLYSDLLYIEQLYISLRSCMYRIVTMTNNNNNSGPFEWLAGGLFFGKRAISDFRVSLFCYLLLWVVCYCACLVICDSLRVLCGCLLLIFYFLCFSCIVHFSVVWNCLCYFSRLRWRSNVVTLLLYL